MDIEFDYKGDPLGGVITNCKYYVVDISLYESPRRIYKAYPSTIYLPAWFMVVLVFNITDGPSRSWLHGSWIYDYPCNQYLSPLTLCVWIPLRQGVLDTTLCDKVCKWLVADLWFSPDTPVSPNNKTDLHGITEILLKVVLSTIIIILNITERLHLTFNSQCFICKDNYLLWIIIKQFLYTSNATMPSVVEILFSSTDPKVYVRYCRHLLLGRWRWTQVLWKSKQFI